MIEPRVALIEPVGSHGGCDYYDSGLAGSLTRAGIYTKWYTCENSQICGSTQFPIETPFIGIWGKDPGWLRGVRYLRGLFASLADARASSLNIAHYHLYHVGVLEFLGVVLARMFLLKVILTVHDVEAFKPGIHSKILRYLTYWLASQIIVHNNVSKSELVRLNPEVESKTHIIAHGSYVGLIPDRLPKSDARLKLGLPLEEKIILFFGQIKEVKGLELLISAFAKSNSKIAPVKLVIAGKVWKDDFSKYQKLIDEYQIGHLCQLDIRYIPDQEISSFYSAADLIVLPYKKIYQSGVLLMAMSYGALTLASDLPGMKEIITHKRNGFLFEANNSDDLSEKLVDVFSSVDKFNEVIANATDDMHNRFSWDVIAGKTRKVYESAIGV